jgi:hypothetical protein
MPAPDTSPAESTPASAPLEELAKEKVAGPETAFQRDSVDASKASATSKENADTDAATDNAEDETLVKDDGPPLTLGPPDGEGRVGRLVNATDTCAVPDHLFYVFNMHKVGTLSPHPPRAGVGSVRGGQCPAT